MISLGVDSQGYMHLVWGMHNTNLNSSATTAGYYISNVPVNDSTFTNTGPPRIKFNKQTSLVVQ